MFSFSKKVAAIFGHFDKGFKEMDELVDQLDTELDKKLEKGVEHETQETERRPDGTVIERRTIIRKM